MWVFYLISLPLTMGMVAVTLRYFAGPDVPKYVLFTVAYAWFCSLNIIILVPPDIWTTLIGHEKGGIVFFWSWSYWSTFFLTWFVVPTIQGYEDAGDFTVIERLKTSVHQNLIFYLCVGSIGLFGLILLIIMHKNWGGNIVGFAMACSNTFGLVTGAFLLGFGLSEIPKNLWRNSDWNHRQKVLTHRVAKMAVNLDNAHQEFSNAIVVAQATSNQMSKRDPLRHCMNVIDGMLRQMFQEDPSFKPSGGRLGENDMDYDTDEKSMAALRRQLRRAREEYYRYKSEYMKYVVEALELEDTVKNYERRHSTGWKYVSSFRESRAGSIGSFFDMLELLWRCILKKQLVKLLAIILGCMSAAILLAEATILPSAVDLSLFSILINSVGKTEIIVQIAAFVPLIYMCICTYYSLFKIGMLMFYSLTPRQTSSVSLLMICSMVARYAPPICYNFLNLIRLGDNTKTVFEQRMGNIDQAVPFFGLGFNKVYPLIMVIYTMLVVSNFFGRIVEFFGKWKRIKLQNVEEDMNGFDPSGMIILQKERSWLEQGCHVGEQVIPLARNFNNSIADVELGSSTQENGGVDVAAVSSKSADGSPGSHSKTSKNGSKQKYSRSAESIANKYSPTTKEQNRKVYTADSEGNNVSTSSASARLLESDNSLKQSSGIASVSAAGLVSTWASVKTGFQSLKANVGAKKFLPLRNSQESAPPLAGPPPHSESLDEIFRRLKRTDREQKVEYSFDDDDDDNGGDGMEIVSSDWPR